MATPDEPGIIVNNNDGLIDMYPEATEQVFRALGQVGKTFGDALAEIRKVLEKPMTLGNGDAGREFLNAYRDPAAQTFRYAHQTPAVLDGYSQSGITAAGEYRKADAENAARLRAQRSGR